MSSAKAPKVAVPPVAPQVLGPYVHPKVWGGHGFVSELRLLAVTPQGALVWIYAGSSWGGTRSGMEPCPAQLEYVALTDHAPSNFVGHKTIHEGGRLTAALLETHRAAIEAHIGAGNGALLHPRKCVLLDGATLPAKAYLPDPAPSKPALPVPPDIDPAAVRAALGKVRELAAATPAQRVTLPAAFKLGAVDVRLVFMPGKTTHSLAAILDTRLARDEFETELLALRDRCVAALAALRATIPERHGAPLATLEVEFIPSRAAAATWTPGHVAVVRKLARDVFGAARAEADVHSEGLRLSVALTTDSPKPL